MENNEKRSGVRVSFRSRIQVHYEGKVMDLQGDSANISMKGILVESSETIAVGTKCRVVLSLAGTREPLELTMAGEVIRHDTAGFGIHFEEMDLDSYSTLKEIVRHNVAGDPDEV